jgi:hypothetical protein
MPASCMAAMRTHQGCIICHTIRTTYGHLKGMSPYDPHRMSPIRPIRHTTSTTRCPLYGATLTHKHNTHTPRSVNTMDGYYKLAKQFGSKVTDCTVSDAGKRSCLLAGDVCTGQGCIIRRTIHTTYDTQLWPISLLGAVVYGPAAPRAPAPPPRWSSRLAGGAT